MYKLMRYGRWLSCIAALAMVASPIIAAEPSGDSKRTPRPFDVVISQTGTIQGQVLSAAGQAQINTTVAIVAKSEISAATKTNKLGLFELPVSKTGVYRIAVGDRAFTVRAWKRDLAPPSARESLLCVSQGTVRAQYGCATPGCGAAAPCGPACGAPAPCGGATCGAAAPCGPSCGAAGYGGGGFSGGGGLMSILSNPVVIGLGVATAIALPLALDDDDDNNSSVVTDDDDGGSGEPAS